LKERNAALKLKFRPEKPLDPTLQQNPQPNYPLQKKTAKAPAFVSGESVEKKFWKKKGVEVEQKLKKIQQK